VSLVEHVLSAVSICSLSDRRPCWWSVIIVNEPFLISSISNIEVLWVVHSNLIIVHWVSSLVCPQKFRIERSDEKIELTGMYVTAQNNIDTVLLEQRLVGCSEVQNLILMSIIRVVVRSVEHDDQPGSFGSVNVFDVIDKPGVLLTGS
jgi:hypothetical protein